MSHSNGYLVAYDVCCRLDQPFLPYVLSRMWDSHIKFPEGAILFDFALSSQSRKPKDLHPNIFPDRPVFGQKRPFEFRWVDLALNGIFPMNFGLKREGVKC